MFVINDDLSIYITRGDAAKFFVTADFDGIPYRFQTTDIVRFKVFEKKGCDCVVLQRDFAVTEAADMVEIALTRLDTKIGGIIHKPKDYWYEVELNPDTHPQTIIGYDEDGAKVFRLLPEGKDYDDERPDYDPSPDAYQYMIDMTARNVALTMQAQRVSTKAMTDSATAIKDSAEAKALAQEVKDRADSGEFKGEKGDTGLTGQKGRGYEGNKKLTLIAEGVMSGVNPAIVEIPNLFLYEKLYVLSGSGYNGGGAIYYGAWNGKYTQNAQYDDAGQWYPEYIMDREGMTYICPVSNEYLGRYELNFFSGGCTIVNMYKNVHLDPVIDSNISGDRHCLTLTPQYRYCSHDNVYLSDENVSFTIYAVEREDNGYVIPEDQIRDAAGILISEHNESETAHSDLRQAVSAAQAEIDRLKENGVAGGGLNEEAANLLIHILSRATYKEDVSSQIERLEEILLGDSGGDTGGDTGDDGGDTDSGLLITDDGNGNVTIQMSDDVSITDDGNGNVTIALPDGISITDDGNGNVIIA